MEPSLSKSRYMIVGVDAATRFVFLGFTPTKGEANNVIQRTVTNINARRGARTVKRVHSNNGGEFIGNNLEEWLEESGIKHTTSAPHTPEHNGLTERTIQIIVSSARTMLIVSGLPGKFWAEACRMAGLIRNLAPAKPLDA